MKKDIFAVLTSAKDRVDVGFLEKYITDNTCNKIDLIDRMLKKVNELLDERYSRYGTISIEESIINKIGLSGHIKSSLDYIRVKIKEYRFSDCVFFWGEVAKDWDNLCFLVSELLEIENFNLRLFKGYLEERRKEVVECPKKYRPMSGLVTMNSNLTEDELKRVYRYLMLHKCHYFIKEGSSERNFIRIFSSYSVNEIERMKIAHKRGAKAVLRALIQELTGGFDSKIVNKCFCNEDGSFLGISSHDRAQKGFSIKEILGS